MDNVATFRYCCITLYILVLIRLFFNIDTSYDI